MDGHKFEKENVLIAKCLKNDRMAQKELFVLYKDAMYTVLYRMLGNVEDAEDALQEGFISIFKNLPSFRGDGSLGGWMKTIFIRIAIKKLHSKTFFSETDDIPDTEITFDDSLTGELLEKTILSLDKGYRTVFLMVEVEGYKHKEVAEILEISEGTSKSQLSRAKNILRKKLAKLGY